MNPSKKPQLCYETSQLPRKEYREASPLSALTAMFPNAYWPSEYWFYGMSPFMEPAHSFDPHRNEP